jgi:hypothetical protein
LNALGRSCPACCCCPGPLLAWTSTPSASSLPVQRSFPCCRAPAPRPHHPICFDGRVPSQGGMVGLSALGGCCLASHLAAWLRRSRPLAWPGSQLHRTTSSPLQPAPVILGCWSSLPLCHLLSQPRPCCQSDRRPNDNPFMHAPLRRWRTRSPTLPPPCIRALPACLSPLWRPTPWRPQLIRQGTATSV